MYHLNPCENNHLIPNPSLGPGVRIVFQPFRINSGGGRASGQVTDARHRRAPADTKGTPANWIPASVRFIRSGEEGQRARRGCGDKMRLIAGSFVATIRLVEGARVKDGEYTRRGHGGSSFAYVPTTPSSSPALAARH